MTYADKRQADIRYDIGVQTRMRDAKQASANARRVYNPDTAARFDHAAQKHQATIDRLQQELRKWIDEI